MSGLLAASQTRWPMRCAAQDAPDSSVRAGSLQNDLKGGNSLGLTSNHAMRHLHTQCPQRRGTGRRPTSEVDSLPRF